MQRRNTAQRQIVYDSLSILGHASTESLIEFIQMHNDDISLATIYRNISILLEENKIKRVKLENHDVLETVKNEHSHFVCQNCKEIFDVDCEKKELIFKSQKQIMHNILTCDVVFYGLCQNCMKKEKEKNEVCM
ncbi:MAG: transcriptional repressor [Anaeroplasmataceae bacterium]|nr:transcriptional repressor [Anaeroplasmataceae bacterium]